jgi:hypothetical protein
MSRHRTRYLAEKGLYVCSRRYCTFTSPNLTEAVAHCVTENKAVASDQESNRAEAA